MLVVSAVHIAKGWVWHTVHQARLHWRFKREGALIAAAAVAAFGAVDSARSMISLPGAAPQDVFVAAAPAVTATATPAFTEPKVVAVIPSPEATAPMPLVEPVDTVSAAISPDFDDVAPEDRLPTDPNDFIAAKIAERLDDPLETASIPVAAKPKPKPAARPATREAAVKPVAVKPVAVRPLAAKPAVKPARAADKDTPAKAKTAKEPAGKTARQAAAEKPVSGKAAPKKPVAKKKAADE